MDIIDNIMYAYQNVPLATGDMIESDYLPHLNIGQLFTNDPIGAPVRVFNYQLPNKMQYCSYADPSIIEKSITRHWYDVNDTVRYFDPNGDTASDFRFSSTYHLIYAYLIENTRIIQIFEKVIEKYIQDEDLGIAEDEHVFNWLLNSEKLFFKNDYPKVTNIRSLIRPSSDASRRNAYYRLLGMDLAFGDSNNPALAGGNNYYKAKASNRQFIPLFENFLAEVWQGYLNARNTSGPNTTDINIITELAIELRELLAARRGAGHPYANRNLSKEEFSSVLLTSWFTFAISYDDSPLLDFMACESSSIGERLLKIGDKVGIPAHKKSQALFEMAGAASNILCALEAENVNVFADAGWVTDMLSSLTPGSPPSIQAHYMTDFLTVINNWEKATGHKIKNRESNVVGTIRVAGVRPAPVTN
ncbi:MAG: hypothetical protein ACM3VS_16250 [Candidatus Dadabacteria bacterium]